MFQYSIGSVNSNLIICLVSIRKAQIVVLQVNIEIRVYEPALDILPNYPRHLIAIDLDNRVFDFDLLLA